MAMLFTDIEDSTHLWERESGRMRAALARHDEVSRQVVDDHGGSVVRTTGDGTFSVFGDALSALQAALELQLAFRNPQEAGGLVLAVRCGVHVGIAEARAGDWYGSSVNRAARIADSAHGGQVLVSQAVVELTRDRLPPDVRFLDLGLMRLRGLDSPERVSQVLHPSLRRAFPPLRSLEPTPSNLPGRRTSFIGRETELADASRLLSETRLLSIVGPGGIGKTRLSLELADRALNDFNDGVWFVELASIEDSSNLPIAVAQALGLPDDLRSETARDVVEYVSTRRLLLVLDNCEHVVGPCSQLVDLLLRSTSWARVVTTSREPLGVEGEQVYRVPSLALPSIEGPTQEVASSDAVRLFVERARQRCLNFEISDGNHHEIARLCTRLDGIPLALELAAARIDTLSVQEIEERLRDRFLLLSDGSRAALPRHKTLRGLIDWSYDLLSEGEKQLFARLSVFVGGWRLGSAEEICCSAPLAQQQVLHLLSGLVQKSMVLHHTSSEHDQQSRFSFLETIREYAQQKLRLTGSEEETSERHAYHFAAYAEETDEIRRDGDSAKWLNRLDADRANLLAAISWCASHAGRTQLKLRLLCSLADYWALRGLLPYGYQTTVAVISSLDRDTANLLHCRALIAAGGLAREVGDLEAARVLAQQGLAMATALEDGARARRAMYLLATVLFQLKALADARTAAVQVVDLATEHGDETVLGGALSILGAIEFTEGSIDKAERLFSRWLDLRRLRNNRLSEAVALCNLTQVSIARGDISAASRRLLDALTIACDLKAEFVQIGCLEIASTIAISQCQWRLAGLWLGAAETRRRMAQLKRDLLDELSLSTFLQRAETSAEKNLFEDARRAGGTVELDEALRSLSATLAGAIRTEQ